MTYPFEISKEPLNKRITANECLHIESNSTDFLFPHVISRSSAFISGCPKDEWVDRYSCMNIYCCENRITSMFFVWDNDFYRYDVVNWRNINIRSNLDYGLGYTIEFNETPFKTLENLGNTTIKMYLSPSTMSKKSSQAITIPSIKACNPSVVGHILYRNLKCYASSSLAINLCKPNVKYIGDILSYASAHGFRGVVFYFEMSNTSKEEDIYNLKMNILYGIRSQKGLFSKLILSTSSTLFTKSFEFISFMIEMLSIEEIRNHLRICINTTVIYSQGYDPYFFLKEIISRIGHSYISLIEVDDHNVPFPLIEKTLSLACHLNIDRIKIV